MRGLDLLCVGVDEKTGKDSALAQAIDGGTHDGQICPYVQPAFSSDLVGIFGHQGNCIGVRFERDLQHLFGRGHFQIDVGADTGAQQAHVAILNVAPVPAQMNCNAVGAGQFADHRGGNDARFRGAPCLADGGHMIDVNVQSGGHEPDAMASSNSRQLEVGCNCLRSVSLSVAHPGHRLHAVPASVRRATWYGRR